MQSMVNVITSLVFPQNQTILIHSWIVQVPFVDVLFVPHKIFESASFSHGIFVNFFIFRLLSDRKMFVLCYFLVI